MKNAYEGVEAIDPGIEAAWRGALTGAHSHKLAFLPGRCRCAVCDVPMRGLSGSIVGLATNTRQSRKNPSICNLCDDNMPLGGAEIDLGILFADVRGSTALAERSGPTAFAGLLNRFYHAAAESLFPYRALIDKMVGDEVMATFLPNTSHDYRANTVRAAERLLRSVGYGTAKGSWIPVGVGIHAGTAFCGRVGHGDVHDFTALGDPVNTAARLQALARPGEVVMSEELYRAVAADYPDLPRRTQEVRGREALVEVRVLRV